MNVLADTQILIWYVTDPARLSAAALLTIQDEAGRDERIGVSAFSLVEILYAVEKATNPLSAENRTAIGEVLGDPESPFEVLPVDAAAADQVAMVPRVRNADPGDRLIVATAEVHGLAIITADRKVPTMTDQAIIW